MLSWFLTLGLIRGGLISAIQPWVAGIGIIFLVLAILQSVLKGRGGSSGGGSKMWRGERISYASPYGEGILRRLRRILGGR
jgi:hypothetical protein